MFNNLVKFDKPAELWEEAFPLGNGHIGAMIYGGIDHEVIQFNHDTFWSGCVKDETDPNKKNNISKVREFLFNERYYEAEKVIETTMMGTPAECYLPIGFLNIRNLECGGMCDEYSRELSLENAEVNIHYKRISSRFDDMCPEFDRKAFISYPHNVFAMKIKGYRDDPIRLVASVESDVEYKTEVKNNTIYMTGRGCGHILGLFLSY